MAGTIQGTGFAGSPTPVVHRSRGVVRIECAITTDAAGVATATVIGDAFGKLVSVFYDGGLDASASVTLTDTLTGATVFGPYVTGTEGTPVTLKPKTNVVTDAGATIAAADTAPNIWRDIAVGGKLSLGVTAGGNLETCKFAFIFNEQPLRTLVDPALTV